MEEHDQILDVCFLGVAATQQKSICQFQSGHLHVVLPIQDSQTPIKVRALVAPYIDSD